MNELLLKLGIPTGVLIITYCFTRFLPKEKTGKIIYSFIFKVFRSLSFIGNSKIGSKMTVKLEQAIIPTLQYWVIMAANGAYDGSMGDNEGNSSEVAHEKIKKEVEKKLDQNISKSFNEAMENLK